MGKNVTWVRRWVELSAERIGESRELLIDLDRQIGDEILIIDPLKIDGLLDRKRLTLFQPVWTA